MIAVLVIVEVDLSTATDRCQYPLSNSHRSPIVVVDVHDDADHSCLLPALVVNEENYGFAHDCRHWLDFVFVLDVGDGVYY